MVTCYPTIGKQKAVDICQTFADGCGGQVVTDGVLRDGRAMFFGVNQTNEHIWRLVLEQKRDFYYVDNAYFDSTRQDYFRITKNALQHPGTGTSNGRRFDALGIAIEPWRQSGEHIVMVPQSDGFMKVVAGLKSDWLKVTRQDLEAITRRPIRVRTWSPDKGALLKTLAQDLDGAHALVTWSSAAAITAVLSGVPVVSMGPSAAASMGGTLAGIETLPRPETRRQWASVLADRQFTLDEMRSGYAWTVLNDR